MKDALIKDKDIYKNREISWLQFNERVLEEAEDESTPLLERLRFLSIFTSNLDEFYRVRVGILCDQILMDDNQRDDKVGQKVSRQLKDILKATKDLLFRFNEAYLDVMLVMERFGINQVCNGNAIPKPDKDYLRGLFEREIAPAIAPFIIEKRNPFPFFENGMLIVGAILKTRNGNDRLGLIPVPNVIDRIIHLPSDPGRFMLSEDLILMFANKVFHKFDVVEKAVFSIIRNADINEDEGLYDYDADFKDTMSKIIERRGILAPVKVKYNGDACTGLVSYLARALYLKKKQMFKYTTPLNFRFMSKIEKDLGDETLAELCSPHHIPMRSPDIDENGDMLDQIMAGDVLLSYPFENISAMLALMKQASQDDRVESIQITLYRLARNSKIVSELIAAAGNGKKVTCVIELRARFDEESNIDWAGRLEDAGCRVLYGLTGYKIHSKLLSIELNDGRKVCLIGTGNFNESTAKVYTDLSLMTAHEGINSDVQKVFSAIESGIFVQQADHLLVAPLCMKSRIIEMIDEEIEHKRQGKPAEIVMKFNSLTEKDMIDKLIEASQEGVKVKLIIRGMCCLIPGIPDITENITVRSIVGRYLEHSRIFVFGAGRGRKKKYFISSADLMTRNMTRRVEVAVPVYDRACQAKLRRILDLNFSDNIKARILRPSGIYERIPASRIRKPINSQFELEEHI